jgi:hypothetical protein
MFSVGNKVLFKKDAIWRKSEYHEDVMVITNITYLDNGKCLCYLTKERDPDYHNTIHSDSLELRRKSVIKDLFKTL